MKKILLIWVLLFPFFGIAQQKVSIIPQPVSLSVQDGYFVIDKNTSFTFNKNDQELFQAAKFFNSFIKNISGNVLAYHTKKNKSIILELKKTAAIGNEGYLLEVTPSAVKIIANTKAGIVYGMQSLIQTLPQIRTNAVLQVPCMKITDYPQFKWRGMHLVVCSITETGSFYRNR